jgi:hypothetical protein
MESANLSSRVPSKKGIRQRSAKRMWNIVVTEIQDANTLDPRSAPPGAFLVSTERFNRTVDHLDLSKLISVIDGMQSSRGRVRRKKNFVRRLVGKNVDRKERRENSMMS